MAQDLALGREPTTLIIVEPNSPPAELLTEDSILFPQIVDDLLLLLVHPTGDDHGQQLPGCESHSARLRHRERDMPSSTTHPLLRDLLSHRGLPFGRVLEPYAVASDQPVADKRAE